LEIIFFQDKACKKNKAIKHNYIEEAFRHNEEFVQINDYTIDLKNKIQFHKDTTDNGISVKLLNKEWLINSEIVEKMKTKSSIVLFVSILLLHFSLLYQTNV